MRDFIVASNGVWEHNYILPYHVAYFSNIAIAIKMLIITNLAIFMLSATIYWNNLALNLANHIF